MTKGFKFFRGFSLGAFKALPLAERPPLIINSSSSHSGKMPTSQFDLYLPKLEPVKLISSQKISENHDSSNMAKKKCLVA